MPDAFEQALADQLGASQAGINADPFAAALGQELLRIQQEAERSPKLRKPRMIDDPEAKSSELCSSIGRPVTRSYSVL